MQPATVIGHATATVRHPSLGGRRLVVVQPLDARGGDDGPPLIAVDELGSGRGDTVILTSDGTSIREMLGTNDTPVRWAVLGLADGDIGS